MVTVSFADNTKVTRYVCNLRSQGIEVMPDDVRLALQELRHNAWTRGVRATVLGLSTIIVPFFIAAALDRTALSRADSVMEIAMPLMMVLSWVAASFAFKLSHRCALWRRQVYGDLKSGRVEIFAAPEEEETFWITINPGTRRLLSVKGVLLKAARFVRVSEVAEKPVEPLPGLFPMQQSESGRTVRGLSVDEQNELRRMIASYRPASFLPAMYVSAVSAACLLIGAFGGGGDTGFWIAGALLAVVSGYLWIAPVKALVRMAKARRDVKDGLVTRVPVDHLPPNVERAEYLPHTKIIWTIDSEPADWRKAS